MVKLFNSIDDIRHYKADQLRQRFLRETLANKLGYKSFCRCIDNTFLEPFSDERSDRIGSTVFDAKAYGTQVCVDGSSAFNAKMLLEGHSNLLSAVVAFPWGNASRMAKAAEINCYAPIVDEIDPVANSSLFLSGDRKAYRSDIETMLEASSGMNILMKTIINSHALGYEGTLEASRMISEIARLHNVPVGIKNSTGVPTGRYSKEQVSASMEDVWLMRKGAGADSIERRILVKAAGGLTTADNVLDMMLASGLLEMSLQLAVHEDIVHRLFRAGSSNGARVAEQFREKYVRNSAIYCYN